MMTSITTKKGFTLVETMVAISILMLAILGPLSIASSGLKNSIYARDQITAYYLAQEGIEFVRYVRDDNYMIEAQTGTNRDWLEGLDECKVDTNADGCAIHIYEWSGNPSPLPVDYIEPCNNNICSNPQMYVSSQGNYTYTSGAGSKPAPFSRSIKIEPVSGSYANEVKITSTMTWQAGSFGQKSFELTEHISNLYKNL